MPVCRPTSGFALSSSLVHRRENSASPFALLIVPMEIEQSR
jgi:hypothetical protein